MLNFLYDLYAFFFSRKIFYSLNKRVYVLSLRGLGILNYRSDKQSGEANFIQTHLSNEKAGIVFDVGANVGEYSRKIRSINKDVEIHCFEPHPVTFQKLQTAVNGFEIKAHNYGVGCVKENLKLYDYENADGSEHASLYKDVIEVIHEGRATAHDVKIVTLNDFANEYNVDRVLLLKIDAEGHELAVLKGFESFLREGKIDLIHFEFNKLNVVSKVFFKDFWDILPNYDLYRMVRDGLVPIKNYDPVYCEVFAYQNVVAKLKPNFRGAAKSMTQEQS